VALGNLKVGVCPAQGQGRHRDGSGLLDGLDKHYRRPCEPPDAPELISYTQAGREVFQFGASNQVVRFPLGEYSKSSK
jgi:hypothetical protein